MKLYELPPPFLKDMQTVLDDMSLIRGLETNWGGLNQRKTEEGTKEKIFDDDHFRNVFRQMIYFEFVREKRNDGLERSYTTYLLTGKGLAPDSIVSCALKDKAKDEKDLEYQNNIKNISSAIDRLSAIQSDLRTLEKGWQQFQKEQSALDGKREKRHWIVTVLTLVITILGVIAAFMASPFIDRQVSQAFSTPTSEQIQSVPVPETPTDTTGFSPKP